MDNYFKQLNAVKCEVEKKNGLNYVSWASAWHEVKSIHPYATYRKIKNELDNSYLFKSGTGGSVEVEVTIKEITHKADLAVTDFKNQEIKYESIRSTDIQNTLQRAFAKAIAMHGIGLYVYMGEDIPQEEKKDKGRDTDKIRIIKLYKEANANAEFMLADAQVKEYTWSKSYAEEISKARKERIEFLQSNK